METTALTPDTLINALKTIRLGYDIPKTVAWLEMSAPVAVLQGTTPPPGALQFSKVIIGATMRVTPLGSGPALWGHLRPRDIRSGVTTLDPGNVIIRNAPLFQRSIYQKWHVVAPHPRELAESWPDTPSSAGFILRTLRELSRLPGLDGTVPTFAAPSHGEVVTVDKVIQAWHLFDPGPPALASGEDLEFSMVEAFSGFPDERLPSRDPAVDTRRIDPIVSSRSVPASKLLGFAYNRDTVNAGFGRIISYGFRGDTRTPSQIKDAGGFLPNYTRAATDVQSSILHAELVQALDHWNSEPVRRRRSFGRTLVSTVTLETLLEHPPGRPEEWAVIPGKHREVNLILQDWAVMDVRDRIRVNPGHFYALDLREFLFDQSGRGFISLTKSLKIAKRFATGITATSVTTGWVYACFAVGAFHIPPRSSDPSIPHDEQELAIPGMVDWSDVVGYRPINADEQFTGKVRLRTTACLSDGPAMVTIWRLLSGESQGR